MIIFCAFEQMQMVIEEGKKHGLNKSYPIFFLKNFSAKDWVEVDVAIDRFLKDHFNLYGEYAQQPVY